MLGRSGNPHDQTQRAEEPPNITTASNTSILTCAVTNVFKRTHPTRPTDVVSGYSKSTDSALRRQDFRLISGYHGRSPS